MDPNVQVAAIGVFATTITTAGLIAVAIINNKKERAKAATAGVDAGLDERSVLGLMFSLMSENERKEEIIQELKQEVFELKTENRVLKRERAGKGGTSP